MCAHLAAARRELRSEPLPQLGGGACSQPSPSGLTAPSLRASASAAVEPLAAAVEPTSAPMPPSHPLPGLTPAHGVMSDQGAESPHGVAHGVPT